MDKKHLKAAIERLIDMLPDEAVHVSEGGDTVEIFIDWGKVPDA